MPTATFRRFLPDIQQVRSDIAKLIQTRQDIATNRFPQHQRSLCAVNELLTNEIRETMIKPFERAFYELVRSYNHIQTSAMWTRNNDGISVSFETGVKFGDMTHYFKIADVEVADKGGEPIITFSFLSKTGRKDQTKIESWLVSFMWEEGLVNQFERLTEHIGRQI